jgi:YVTN family beta-propeller protein
MVGIKILLMGILSVSACAAVANAADMKVTERWPLAGPVVWDYLAVDSTGSHLFITRSTQVDVIDTHTGKVIATIPNTSGVHGVALAEATKRGYVSNGKSDTVTMFDLDTFKTLQEAPVAGHNPDAILYDDIGHHLFTFNGRSGDVSVLSPTDLKVLATIKVPGKPEFAAADDKGQIFANIQTEPGQLVVIDARQLELTAVWKLNGCDSPSGLAIDKARQRLFSVCDNKVMVVTDSGTGKQVSTITIGNAPDAVAYDERSALIFCSNGEGSLSIVHQDTPDKYRVVQTLLTKRGARTMALDASHDTVYLPSADFPTGPVPEHTGPHAVPNSFAILKVTP